MTRGVLWTRWIRRSTRVIFLRLGNPWERESHCNPLLVEPRIEAVVAEASFASLREAAYDYAGLQRYPLLGMTLLAPGAWTMVYHGELAAGFPAGEVSPEKAVAARPFPVLLICDAKD